MKDRNLKSLPPDLTVDDPHNCKFDKVPDSELVACSYWEYARESAFIRKAMTAWLDCRYCDGIDAIFDTEHLGPMLLGQSEMNPDFPQPWQALAEERQAALVAAAMQKPKPMSLCNGNPFTKTVLAALASRYENVIAEWKSKYAGKKVPVPGENDARLSVWWPNSRGEYLLFSIGWDYYSNKQICAAFKRKIGKIRPMEFRKPKGRPRGTIKPRAALRCLAIMRALHKYPADKVATELPDLYLSCNKKHFRDRERAGQMFQQLIASRKGELPLSWSPAK